MKARTFLVVAAAVALSACGGGGGSAPAPLGPAGTTPTAAPAPAGSGTLSFGIAIPSTTGTASAGRSPKYVSPSTASVTVTLAGQTAPLATANLGATAPGCSVVPNGVTCTVTVTAPAGSNTFIITTYNGTNGTGQQLSTARIAATVGQNTTTQVALTLNGVVATTAVILGSSTAPVGAPASIAVTVNAYDQGGSLIVGPGTFSTPITLTLTDASGNTSLSTMTVSAPGTSVTLTYNGNSMGTATITPSNATANGSATFTPTGNAVTSYSVLPMDYNYINVLAPSVAGDRAIWYGSNGVIGRMSTTGAVTEYTSGLNDVYALAPGSDGNMWFGDDTDMIGSITPSGTVTYVSPGNYTTPCGPSLCSYPNYMTLGPDGNVWFSDDNGYIGRITPAGLVQEWDITALPGWPGGNAEPNQIAFVGNTLYVGDYYDYIDAITISGGAPTGVTQLTITSNCEVYGLAVGPDGNIWFSDDCENLGMVPPGNFTAGGMLMWGIGGLTDDEDFGYLAANAAGVFAMDDYTNNVYRIFPSTSLSANNGPAIMAIPAFAYAYSYVDVITTGPDGNIWVTEDEETPETIAKVIAGGATSGALSVKRASSSISHRHVVNKGRHAQWRAQHLHPQRHGRNGAK